MSTYLVCFIVGKFEKVSAQIPVVIAGDLNEKKNRQENEIDNNIVTRNKDISYFGKVGDMRNISVYTIPELAEQGRFALDVACQVIPFYEGFVFCFWFFFWFFLVFFCLFFFVFFLCFWFVFVFVLKFNFLKNYFKFNTQWGNWTWLQFLTLLLGQWKIGVL